MDILVVIDMQNDFIDGSLGSKEAQAIVNAVVKQVERFSGPVFFTMDTHPKSYLSSQEGRLLPVEHCIEGTLGWQLHEKLAPYANAENTIKKNAFGSLELPKRISASLNGEKPENIICIGLCTDVCVICGAAILKAAFPESKLIVDASCCTGVTIEKHINALQAMKAFQINIINEA